MESIEIRLKQFILNRYKSLLDFSKSINMPYSTIDNIFKRGVGNANIANIIKICTELNISADELAIGNIMANTPKTNNINQITATSRSGEIFQLTLSDEEMHAILTLLKSMQGGK